jgi:hypothetical protein
MQHILDFNFVKEYVQKLAGKGAHRCSLRHCVGNPANRRVGSIVGGIVVRM